MTAIPIETTTLSGDHRDMVASLTQTLRASAGPACSPTLWELGQGAGRAYAAALGEPGSRAAWTAFVQAVFAFLDELDAGVGVALDLDAARSRHDLRDIVYENSDLL
ncbi:MAG TPA: hypothetical protein VGX96_11355 [Candidatus Elarobacter sp.]|jgi:hypothetical protein|nr:hypothetical protein [Candidatus Elarobacter sp.]